jgi:AcrR family transcriptional regulator
MRPGRRRAADDSSTRDALLDAAEAIMTSEGYAAVSSRRVAARAGMNPALVYYYFDTMDGLFIEMFRRRSDRSVERFAQALLSPQPLWAFWEITHDQDNNARTMEFIALANHRKAIRAEIAKLSRQHRQMQIDVLTRALQAYGLDIDAWPPVTVILAMAGISRYLLMEEAFGIDTGHREMVEVIEREIRALEGDPVTFGTATLRSVGE